MENILLNKELKSKLNELGLEYSELLNQINKVNYERKNVIVELFGSFKGFWFNVDEEEEEIEFPFEFRNKHSRMVNFRVIGVLPDDNDDFKFIIHTDEDDCFKAYYYDVDMSTEELDTLFNIFEENKENLKKYNNELDLKY